MPIAFELQQGSPFVFPNLPNLINTLLYSVFCQLPFRFLFYGSNKYDASSKNQHFFTKSCHRQTYQNYEESQ